MALGIFNEIPIYRIFYLLKADYMQKEDHGTLTCFSHPGFRHRHMPVATVPPPKEFHAAAV